MSLYLIFTVDGDWNEYFHAGRPNAERLPDAGTLQTLLSREMSAAAVIGNKVLHFFHTSSVAPDLFLQPAYSAIWKKSEALGGSVGVHCHHKTLYRDACHSDPVAMERSIDLLTRGLRSQGLHPISYRGGYMTFCEKNIPFLEKNGLVFDFSCDPGRYLRHEGEVIADWRGASDNYYRMSCEDRRKPGTSKVVEIPLGKAGGDALYIDNMSLVRLWRAARALARRAAGKKGDVIVSVLTHTYEFSSFWKTLRVTLALFICKMFGIFINDREAVEIINNNERGQSS